MKILPASPLRHAWLFLLFLSGPLSYLHLHAQPRPLGSWNIVHARMVLDDRWAVWTEGQLRSRRFYDDYFYFEIKGGITYQLNDHIALTAGTGRYETYSEGGNFEQPLVQGETRTWLQLVMENQLGRVNFDHRYRAEQRHTTNGFRQRYRYRLNMVVPINQAVMKPTTLYAYLGDEIFLTNKAPFYERNRFFTGLGYKISTALVIQSGYLRQFDYKQDSHTSRDYLQVALLFNINPRGNQKDHVPKITD